MFCNTIHQLNSIRITFFVLQFFRLLHRPVITVCNAFFEFVAFPLSLSLSASRIDNELYYMILDAHIFILNFNRKLHFLLINTLRSRSQFAVAMSSETGSFSTFTLINVVTTKSLGERLPSKDETNNKQSTDFVKVHSALCVAVSKLFSGRTNGSIED